MEYHADLKFWYTGSYGSDINREVNCPQVKDIADTFKCVKNFEHIVGPMHVQLAMQSLLCTT